MWYTRSTVYSYSFIIIYVGRDNLRKITTSFYSAASSSLRSLTSFSTLACWLSSLLHLGPSWDPQTTQLCIIFFEAIRHLYIHSTLQPTQPRFDNAALLLSMFTNIPPFICRSLTPFSVSFPTSFPYALILRPSLPLLSRSRFSNQM